MGATIGTDAGITATIVDGGPHPIGPTGLKALSRSSGVPTWELVRTEAVVDPLVAAGASVDEILAAVGAALDPPPGARVVGAKTVLAYPHRAGRRPHRYPR